MPEKRELKRRHPVYYLQVISLDSGENLGYLIDINAKGHHACRERVPLPDRKGV